MASGTQACNSVQSACNPHRHPVENRLNSQMCFFLLTQSHRFLPLVHVQGTSISKFFTKWRPKTVPPVFCMCKNTSTSSPSISKSYLFTDVSRVTRGSWPRVFLMLVLTVCWWVRMLSLNVVSGSSWGWRTGVPPPLSAHRPPGQKYPRYIIPKTHNAKTVNTNLHHRLRSNMVADVWS